MHWSNVSKPSSSPVKTFSAPICGRFIDLSRRCCIERFRSSVVAGNLPISGNINLEYSVLGVFSSLQQALRSFVERFVTVRFKKGVSPSHRQVDRRNFPPTRNRAFPSPSRPVLAGRSRNARYCTVCMS